jgi:hypothetical protein
MLMTSSLPVVDWIDSSSSPCFVTRLGGVSCGRATHGVVALLPHRDRRRWEGRIPPLIYSPVRRRPKTAACVDGTGRELESADVRARPHVFLCHDGLAVLTSARSATPAARQGDNREVAAWPVRIADTQPKTRPVCSLARQRSSAPLANGTPAAVDAPTVEHCTGTRRMARRGLPSRPQLARNVRFHYSLS